MRYRKKPVVVEAIRLTEESIEDVQEWLIENGTGSYPAFDGCGLIIPTLEGDMEGRWGDWIIKGVQGEFYPCKPDIFENSYEETT